MAVMHSYRNSCIYDGVPNGFASVVLCVRVATSSAGIELTLHHAG